MRAHHILDAPAGARIASFTVESLLGTGGCGVVYRAARGEEVVALKLQSLEGLGGQAFREVSILSRLKHRNVVGFRECGVYPTPAPRWAWVAMEYVHGRTLKQWVEEENPGARRAAELLRGLARGLEAAHAERVLHRDIKESNVVVREEDGEAVLVDFGAGDYAGAPPLTSEVLPPGTYRSPEALAFRGGHGPLERYTPAPADDLYALGVVFYWVLTGRHPFEGADTPDAVEAILHQAPVAPDVRNPRVPPVLSALCLRLLSKRPEARGTAREAHEAVEAALAEAGADWEAPLGEALARPLQAPEEKASPLIIRARPVAPSPRPGALLRAVALAGLVAGVAVAAYATRPWQQAGRPQVMAGSVSGADARGLLGSRP
jgi:serine/threonine-protein kinase